MRTKIVQNNEFRATRGVERHRLFECLGAARPRDKEELTATYPQPVCDDALARTWSENQCDGLTLWHGAQAVACLIAWSPTPGHWTCGMVATEQWPDIALAASRYLKRYLRPVLLGQGVRRASCVVDANYKEAIRWLGFLGFEQEGRMKRYGQDGRDFLMFAYVPKFNLNSEE